jgi:hypothetical protein
MEQYIFSHMHSRSSKWHGMVTCFKKWAVREFLVAEKESGTNIHKQFTNVYGVKAVDKSMVGHWVSQIAGSKKGQADLSDICHYGHCF